MYTSNADQTPSTNSDIKFPDIILASGINPPTALSTIFTLPAGGTYRVSGGATASGNTVYQFYVNNSYDGTAAQSGAANGTVAMVYVKALVDTTVSLRASYGSGVMLGRTSSQGRGPWIEIQRIALN
jgi:hypothetical protein